MKPNKSPCSSFKSIERMAKLSPYFFVNITDSWVMPNRNNRMLISAAGIYVERDHGAELPALHLRNAISASLGVAATALSFHLKELVAAGLVTFERASRNLIYRANFDRMNGLLAYLTEHCCQGEPCEVTPAAGCSNC